MVSDSMRSAFFAQVPLAQLHRLGRGGGVVALILSALAGYEAGWSLALSQVARLFYRLTTTWWTRPVY